LSDSIKKLTEEMIQCFRCPRLVAHREAVAANPPLRHRGETYWGKPVPGFGDPKAKIYVIGLAPAANGGNRTGRVFTGDRSGDWLYAALHEVGFASQAQSVSKNDGMKLHHTYIGAAVRCAPPGNKPTLQEFKNCHPYLVREFQNLKHAFVYIALGGVAYNSLKKVLRETLELKHFKFPAFAHGLRVELPNGKMILCSYHPSQQNTFTGKLTRTMFLKVFQNAKTVMNRRQKNNSGFVSPDFPKRI
jgi:uracil-DNA glycosylase family 4